jgi:hypothetical protein
MNLNTKGCFGHGALNVSFKGRRRPIHSPGIKPESFALLAFFVCVDFLFFGAAFAESPPMYFPALRSLVTFSHANTSFLYGTADSRISLST